MSEHAADRADPWAILADALTSSPASVLGAVADAWLTRSRPWVAAVFTEDALREMDFQGHFGGRVRAGELERLARKRGSELAPGQAEALADYVRCFDDYVYLRGYGWPMMDLPAMPDPWPPSEGASPHRSLAASERSLSGKMDERE